MLLPVREDYTAICDCCDGQVFSTNTRTSRTYNERKNFYTAGIIAQNFIQTAVTERTTAVTVVSLGICVSLVRIPRTLEAGL